MRTEDYGFFVDKSVSWAVVNAQPHREALAIEHLGRQDFEAYCPMIRKRVRHARKWSDVSRPFFPGYLFVKVAPQRQRWRPILSTIGVRSLIRTGEDPALLPDDFIEGLRSREIDGFIARPEQNFHVGQEIRMAGGAFDGLIATIVELKEKDRLVVLMNLLNGQVKVRVGADSVSAI